MKKKLWGILLVIVFTLSPFTLPAASYDFSEPELEVFVTEIVNGVTDEKDLEIADIIGEHDLIIVDKDLEIDTLTISEESLKKEVKLLEGVNGRQSKLLYWAPVTIVTTFIAGVLTGFFTAGNL